MLDMLANDTSVNLIPTLLWCQLQAAYTIRLNRNPKRPASISV